MSMTGKTLSYCERRVSMCYSAQQNFTMTGLDIEPGTKQATNSLRYDKAGYFKLSPSVAQW